jgi:subtilisin family serine protease
VYVVDANLQSVFAFSRHDQRPVRLARGPVSKPAVPSSVAVNDSALYILSGNELQRWPRLVPAEVHLRLASVSESMSRVYEYLGERDILPVRRVRFEQNIERTLKQNRVILAGYPATLDRLLCQLNPGLCDGGGKIKRLPSGIDLLVPDLYSENYVDAVAVLLRGDESLGQVADKRVTSPEFAEWKSEQRLKELNESQLAREKAGSARDVKSGQYMTPVEYVRYLVPAVAGDASGTGPLKRLESVFEGLRVISLEERPPTSASARGLPGLQEPDLGTLKVQFAALLAKIDYFAPTGAPSLAKVGIAEEFIDPGHADLQSALMAQDGVQPVPAAAAPPPASIKYLIRSFQKSDHGTMVAGLIGARASGFDHGGLAPKAMLLPLRNVEPAIGEDIRRARLRGVFIFNVSAHYDVNVIPQSLRAAIEQYQDSLFIVAAGNDLVLGANSEVCRDFLVFPACWHDKKNVLVVTATTVDGDVILAASKEHKGANWSGSSVHLGAPGVGYHAPAVGNSYAPVQGSSFATPLVTATAALLYAQSVARPEPLSIKQRLIATADPEPGLAGKLVGGRLNVRRALMNLGFGVLTRSVPQPDNTTTTETERIVLEDGRITVRQPNGNDMPIQVRQLRRVHRYGNGYRIVYVDHRNQLDVLENVNFTTEQDAKFGATTEAGAVITVNLVEWADFVAPF